MLGVVCGVLLRRELRLWTRAGHRPQLWWRDDDARSTTPALRRLIAIADAADTPLALAVIPLGMDPGLPDLVNSHRRVWVLQHGTDHRDAKGFSRPSQFAGSVAAARVAEAIRSAARTLDPFAQALPVYVPPWNDLQPNVAAAVVRLGLRGVSCHGQPRSFPGLCRLDIHLDLMRWRGAPRFKGRGRLISRLTALLRQRRREGRWDEPIGLLTHHLDHDEPAWAFLHWLLTWPPLRNHARWLSAEDAFRLEDGPSVLVRLQRRG